MLTRLTSLLGIAVLIGIAWLASNNRRRPLPWRMIFWGIALQFIFAVLVLGIPALGFDGPLRFLFAAANDGIDAAIGYTLTGSKFVFGKLVDEKQFGFILAVQVLPTIIFIGAVMSVLYHIGVMQKITHGFAVIMQKTMKTSGAETLAAAANIFVGQTEAPLIIKPFVSGLTNSELLCVMVGGMANTAGGVMAAYVGLLHDRMPNIAGHLLTASILSAPAALLLSKIILPETTKPETFGRIPAESAISPHANIIDAAAAGAAEGLTLALNVAAMLIAFIALIALGNGLLGIVGGAINFASWGGPLTPEALRAVDQAPTLSLQMLLGWIFAPVAWAIGVPSHEIAVAGALMGEKTILNEFVAYVHLAELAPKLTDRTAILMSYALSGFANFSSIAIQIGGIAPLAPHRRGDLARLGVRAVIGGTLSSMMTATVVGSLL